MDMRGQSLAQTLVDDHRNAAHSEIIDADLPIKILSASVRQAPPRVTSWEGVDDSVTVVRVLHDAGQAGGSVVTVSTCRWAGTNVRSGSLRDMLEHDLRLGGERISALHWTTEDTEIAVDGRAVTAEAVRAGDRWWAVRCTDGDIEISIIGCDSDLSSIEVETVADVPAFLSWALPDLSLPMPPTPQHEATTSQASSQDPLRKLVDVNLSLSQQTYQWLADGGPVPQQAPHLSTMWQAAVRRQGELADQSEAEAKATVTTIIGQLNNLYHNAAWFRDKPALREKATVETLLYWTEIDQRVSSASAQHAWSEHCSGSRSQVPSLVEAPTDAAWQQAWQTWAHAHAKGD